MKQIVYRVYVIFSHIKGVNPLLEIRIHGRGGQGAQTVGHVIAQAFFNAGRHVQTFATYGGERRGAPVTSYVRVNERPLRLRCDIEHPDVVMVFEPTFLDESSGLAGLNPGAIVVINTTRQPDHFGHLQDYRLVTVDALDIARKQGLGRMVNSAMLGAFVRATGWLTLDEVQSALSERGLRFADANLAAMRDAHDRVQMTASLKPETPAVGKVDGHA